MITFVWRFGMVNGVCPVPMEDGAASSAFD